MAHVARPALLARSLDQAQYEIFFASAHRYLPLLSDLPVAVREIHSITEQQFLERLALGRPLHDADTLRAYVKEDLALLRDIQPDVVVGDLRHSLSISARLAVAPYVSILSAYWSPYARQKFRAPENPATHVLGVPLSNFLFRWVRPFAFAAHCRPMNRVKREYGFAPLGRDLRRIYADADWIVYPDVPEMVPTWNLPATHRYIGPLLWSPTVDRPSWWTELPEDRPVIYITLGSSGSSRVLSLCLEALADEPVTMLVSSLKRHVASVPANARIADFLPGIEAARRSSLVICNGGSPTAHQALAVGTPVLGIPSNIDQHLNMSFVEAAGAGESLRTEHANPSTIRSVVRRLLREPSFREGAARIARSFAAYDSAVKFRELIGEICNAVSVA